MAAATSFLDIQPYLQQMAPTPPPIATPPPVSQSPIHDHVTEILIKNPNATPDDVSKALSIKPSLAAAITGQVKQKLAAGYPSGGAASPPPPNPVTQAFAPPAPSNLSAPPPFLAQALAPAGSPQSMPPPQVQTFPPSVSSAPAAAQVAPGAPGAFPPNASGNPVNPDAAAARAETLANMKGGPVTPSELSPPGVEPPNAMPVAPSQAQHHDNRFLDGLKRFAPALATALLTYKNPQVGAGILGGMQQGQERLDAEQAQKDALARAKTQQDFENDLKTRTQKATETYQAGELTNTAQKNATTADHYKDMAGRYGDQAMTAFNTDIAKFSGNPSAQLQIAARYDKAHGTTEFSESLGNGTGDSDRAKYDNARAAAQQDRVNSYASQVKANIDDIASKAGLRLSQGQFLDTKTGDVADNDSAQNAMRNATADFLSAKTGEVVPLADSDIAYKLALGDAAGINAASGVTRANADAANANTNATKAEGVGGVSDAVRQHIYSNYLSQRSGAFGTKTPAPVTLDQDGNLMSNPAYSTDEKGQLDPAKVTESNDALNEAISQNGGQRYFGKQAASGTANPTVAPVQVPKPGQTPRSMAGKPNQPVPVIPSSLGPNIDATAQAMQKDGRANQPHYCERVARQTYQDNTNAYNKYWAGTAKQTAQNFIAAKIAKPYTPGMPIPAGSLLYSTKMGGDNGHVQVVGNDGTRYDQYGKNRFTPANFNWYVPPPGAKTASSPAKPASIGRFQVTYH